MAMSQRPPIPIFEQVKWERTTESRISTVISMLPVSLQSRMGPFRHFRRSASLGNLRMVADANGSAKARTRPLSATDVAGAPSKRVLTKQAENVQVTGDSVADVLSIRLDTGDADIPAGTASGIRWRFAQQGVNLVGVAADSGVEGHNALFERKAYVDGLTYLLRALPPDLDDYESEQIRFALPADLALSDRRLDQSRSLGWREDDTEGPRSFIHWLVQMTVVHVFLIVHFILPYVVLLLKFGIRVERRYRVSETLVEQVIGVLHVMGRHCSYAAEAVFRGSDGRAGQRLSNAVAWIAEEVTRGISDGVGEGLMMTKTKEPL